MYELIKGQEYDVSDDFIDSLDIVDCDEEIGIGCDLMDKRKFFDEGIYLGRDDRDFGLVLLPEED